MGALLPPSGSRLRPDSDSQGEGQRFRRLRQAGREISLIPAGYGYGYGYGYGGDAFDHSLNMGMAGLEFERCLKTGRYCNTLSLECKAGWRSSMKHSALIFPPASNTRSPWEMDDGGTWPGATDS